MFRLYKRVIFRMLLNLRLITNACHVFYPVPSEISPGLQICLLKPIKLTFLQSTVLVDVLRPLLLGYCIANFLFIGNCFVLKPLKPVCSQSRNSPHFMETRRCIIIFTKARNLSLSSASLIQSKPPHPNLRRSLFFF